jgi:3',5'-cyclic-AMP phosphodiesterase
MKNRREFIKHLGVAGGALAASPGVTTASALNRMYRPGNRALRIAHITDVHLQRDEKARILFSRVLREINSLKDKPDFIINTGDSVMEANNQSKELVDAHWNTWTSAVRSENKLDMYSAIGNHDVWFSNDEAIDKTFKTDKRYGKQWAIELLNMPNRYYSFSSRGWKFICLDSINGSNGYYLDDEQLQWLERQINGSTEYILIFNHIPILSMGAFLYYTKRKPLGEFIFPFHDMHNDHQRIKDLFQQHKRVRACLSGHIHYVDAITYMGVRYFCNGAVSGNWWGDPLFVDDFPPVYAIVDLFKDGSCTNQLVWYNTRM